MAATVVSFPPTPAAVYRPMQLQVQRNDPSGSEISWIKVADATDVTTYGNGLEVGQVFISHGLIQGAVTLQAGQTLHIYRNGGQYLGVWTCINTWGSGPYYTIIDAPAMGDFTPSGSPTSALRVYLSNYTILTKIAIYTDPASDPQEVVLTAQPIDPAGNTYINVDTVLKDFYSNKIDNFLKPLPGVPVQSAHGITANFYGLHIVEVYDSPDVNMATPFDGTHDISVDNMADFVDARVAVNAVHPYASEVIDRTTLTMAPFVLVGGTTISKVLTLAPRGDVQVFLEGNVNGVKVYAEPGDMMWLTVLTNKATWVVPSLIYLQIYDLSGDTPVLGTSVLITPDAMSAAVSVGYGPGNLGAAVAGMTKYSVWLNNEAIEDGAQRVSEPIEVTVSAKCSENRRAFGWLNKLGGIDAHTFTGREIFSSKVKRATVSKPYGVGVGYDWTERTYRAEPQRQRTASTRPLPVVVRRWLAQDMGESPNVVAMEQGICAPCVVLTEDVQGGSTAAVSNKAFTIDYRLGVDNSSQQA